MHQLHSLCEHYMHQFRSLHVRYMLQLRSLYTTCFNFAVSMYTTCINFAVSAADSFNRQQNFIAHLCSFSAFIIENFNLRGVTKTTFAELRVTRQWKMITRWNFDHRRRIDHRSRCNARLHAAIESFAIYSELSVIFGQPLYKAILKRFWDKSQQRFEEISKEFWKSFWEVFLKNFEEIGGILVWERGKRYATH